MKNPRLLKNQSGQIVIEYMLMMVVVLAISFMIQQWLVKDSFVQTFTFSPWVKFNGMVQCGSWTKCGVETPAANIHPNSMTHVLSYAPAGGG